MLFENPICSKLPNKLRRDPLETLKDIRKKSFTKPKYGGRLIVPKKVEMGTLLLWNGFLFHVRGFGCAENQVLSTHG